MIVNIEGITHDEIHVLMSSLAAVLAMGANNPLQAFEDMRLSCDLVDILGEEGTNRLVDKLQAAHAPLKHEHAHAH